MKKVSLISLAVLVSVAIIFAIKYLHHPSDKEYLKNVLTNLDHIKSSTYTLTSFSSDAGDTAMANARVYHEYIKEFANPADTAVGASTVAYWKEDTTKTFRVYDGLAQGEIDWKDKTVRVDSFQNYPYPMRLVGSPFFRTLASLIKYSVETEDSIKIDLKDFGDSVRFNLTIYGKGVEFVPKVFAYPDSGNSYSIFPPGEDSKYEVWIRKSDNLPYRMIREMPFQKTYSAISEVKLDTSHRRSVTAADYYPEGFKISKVERGKPRPKNSLIGEEAADWALRGTDNTLVSLADLESKVIVVQFTGVGCGPCHASLPFLKKLVNDYEGKDFELVGIETWSSNLSRVKRYKERNDINFKFLKSDAAVTKNYQIGAVPVFFILDENRVIRKVINGYSLGVTDREIKAAVDEMI